MNKKLLCVSIFTLLFVCVSFAQEQREDWTYLKGGQKFLGVDYRTDGIVYYADKLLTVCPIDVENQITISTPSKIKGLSIVHCLQDFGESSAVIIDTKNKKTLTEDIVPKQWRLDSWFSWSPNENYLLMAARGEITNGDMFFVDVKIGRTTVIHFKDLTRKGQSEVQDLNLDDFSWINPTTYKLRLGIFCNIYELGEEGCDQNKTLRSYDTQVNVATLAISYGTAKTVTISAKPQKNKVAGKPTQAQKKDSQFMNDDGNTYIRVPQTSTDLTTKNQKQKSQPTNLETYIGKDIDDLLRESSDIRNRLKILLGNNYELFMGNLGVRAELDTKQEFLLVHGLAPHMGGVEEAVFLVSLSNQKIHCAILSERFGRKYKVFSEDSDSIPTRLFDELIYR